MKTNRCTSSTGTTVVQAAPTTGGSTSGSTSPASASAPARGSIQLVDRVRHLTLRSARITNVSVNYRRHLVSVVGLGHANGKSVGFTLTLTDRGAHDLLALRLSNGYRLQGRPAAGGISL